MKKTVRNGIIIAFLLMGIGSFAYYGMLPMEAEVMQTKKDRLVDYVEETGTVISDTETYISPKISGQVIQIHKKNGDLIKKGQLIVELEGVQLENQLQVIESQIKAYGEEKGMTEEQLESRVKEQSILVGRLRSTLNFAKENYDKAVELKNAGSLSEADLKEIKQRYEEANSAYKQAVSGLDSIKLQLESTESAKGNLESLQSQRASLVQQLEDRFVYALSDGMISGMDVKIGQFVSPQYSLGKVISPENYLVECYVLTNDIDNLHVKDQVELVVKKNGIEETYLGTIDMVDGAAEEKISSLGIVEQRVKVFVHSKELNAQVKSGYEVKVKFISEYKEEALSIPKTSIFHEEDEDFVYVVRNKKAQKQKIEIGMDTDSEVSVENGLQEGDLVIKNYKLDGLKEGKNIRPLVE